MMRTHFLSLIFLLISISLIAQSTNVLIGVEFSEDHISGESYLSNSNGLPGSSILRNEYNYTIGVNLTFTKTSNWELKTGIHFTNKDYNSSFYCINCLSIIMQPELRQQRFLTVPLLLGYRNHEKKFKPFFELGIVHNYGLSEPNSVNKQNFLEGQLGIGLAYMIIESLEIELSYKFRSTLSAVYENNILSVPLGDEYEMNKLSTNSLSFGLSYRLN